MPTYDYECTACGYTFEAFQSMSEKPLSKCPECGKKIQRLIGGGIGVIFKGSGFYATDSKKVTGKKNEETSKSTSTTEETKSGNDKNDKSDKKETKDKKKSA